MLPNPSDHSQRSVLGITSRGGLDVGAARLGGGGKSSKSSVLGLVVLVGQALDSLGGVVNFSTDINDRSVNLRLRVGLSLSDTMIKLVLDVERENTSVTFLGLLLLESNAQTVVGGLSDLGSVVQVIQRVRIVSELLLVELLLDKESVVLFGEAPEKSRWEFHESMLEK